MSATNVEDLGLENSFLARQNLKKYFWLFLWFVFIFLDFNLSYRSIGPFPPRNYLTASVCLGFLLFARDDFMASFKDGAGWVLFVVLAPFLLRLPFDLIENGLSGLNLSFYLKPFIKFGPLILCTFLLLRKIEMKMALDLIILVVLISTLVAVGQALKVPAEFDLRYYFDPVSYMTMHKAERPIGLSYYAIDLSYQLLLCFGFLLFRLYDSFKMIYCIGLLAILGGLFINSTRSALLAAIIVPIFFLFFIKKSIRVTAVIVFMALIIFSILAPKLKLEKSMGARIYLYYSSFAIIKENAFIGLGQDYLHLPEILIKYFPNFELPGKKLAENLFSHNFFLNILLSFGFIGAAVHGRFWLKFLVHFRKIQVMRSGIVLPIFAANIMCAVSSLAHNGGYSNHTSLIILLSLLVQSVFSLR